MTFCDHCQRRTMPSVSLLVEVKADANPRSKERTTITVCGRCYRDSFAARKEST